MFGIALAEELSALLYVEDIARPERTGIVLAGDLYATPSGDKRGASGDVRTVWTAFADRFRWVVGVAGNHDQFGSAKEQRGFAETPGIHLLDGGTCCLDGVLFAGLGGITGNPKKAQRREQSAFLEALDGLLCKEPSVLVLHEGPRGEPSQRGSAFVREQVEESTVPLTVCGHAHWSTPTASLGDGRHIINVDARAIVLISSIRR